MSCIRTAMDHYETNWIKKEEIYEVPEPGAMVQVYSSSADAKEELEDGVNKEVQIYPPSVNVKEEIEKDVKQELLEDPFGISWSTDYIKKDPELNLGVDEIENIVATSTTYEPESTKLIQISGERSASFEETVDQGVLDSELEKGANESRHFIFGTHRWGLTQVKQEEDDQDPEDSVFGNRLKCSLGEKEFHKFSCSFCLQSFPSKYRLIRHVFIHIDGVQPPLFVCHSCGDVFSSKVNLNKHLKMNENDKSSSSEHNDKYYCIYTEESMLSKCDQGASITEQSEKQSSSKESGKISNNLFNIRYDKHTVKHNAEKLVKYDNYGTSCTDRNQNDGTGPLTAKRVHKCEVCGKSFTYLSAFKRHSLVHTGIKPHKCDVCGKAFIELGNLKNHISIHTGIKQHLCEFCGKGFIQLSNLKKHTLTHTGIKPHKCGVCGKAFTESGTLKNHALLHTRNRLYKCSFCGRAFWWLRNLKRHVSVHTGMIPHTSISLA